MNQPVQVDKNAAQADLGISWPIWRTWIIGVSFVVVGWGGFAAWQSIHDEKTRVGIFGDAFGVINALASGAGLMGVAYAIHQQQAALNLQNKQTQMQSEELRLQREELAATRQEMKDGRMAQEASAAQMQKQTQINGIRMEMELIELLVREVIIRVNPLQNLVYGGQQFEVTITTNEVLRSNSNALKATPPASARPSDCSALAECLAKIVGYRERREELYSELQTILASGR